MSTKPTDAGGGFKFGDEDFGELDNFGPSDSDGGSSTRVVAAVSVSNKPAITRDQERARALNISMATTLIEPLPAGKVAFLEIDGRAPVVLGKSVTVIGRAAGVADVVLDDEGVSRQHAAIIYAQGEFFVEDLGSSNGTRLGGARVGVAALAPGAEFQLGNARLRLGVRNK